MLMVMKTSQSGVEARPKIVSAQYFDGPKIVNLHAPFVFPSKILCGIFKRFHVILFHTQFKVITQTKVQ